MISVARSRDAQVRALLARHPMVEVVDEGPSLLAFRQASWDREVVLGPTDGPYGLMELMDNNPVVCADRVGVPSPAATLALIALGPLASAGLLRERPTFVSNLLLEEADLQDALATAGWDEGMTAFSDAADLDGVAAGTAMALIETPNDPNDLDDLYDERFGRSFFVRREEEGDWTPERVRGGPSAAYRLRYSPDETTSLLTILVMADLRGKLGAAQVVHAMNVMAGFEESLGIA